MKKSDVEFAHQIGAFFGYLIITICTQLLDRNPELGGDLVIVSDPTLWNLAFAEL